MDFHHPAQHASMISPDLPKAFIMRRTCGQVELMAKGGGLLAPLFGEVERASDTVQATIASDGEVVLVGGSDFSFDGL